MTPPPAPFHRLLGIQYLRAAAALAVVIYHACDRAGASFGAGAAGVDVFFVISGVVMWATTSTRPITPANFMRHRIIRIVPLYWAATLAMAATSVLLPRLLPHLQASPKAVLLSLLFIPYRDTHGQIVPVLVPGWTLDYELFFYALFAASLLLPLTQRIPALLATLLSLATLGLLLHPQAPLALTYTNPLLAEFGAGVLLAAAWQRRALPPAWLGAPLILLALAAYAAIQLTNTPVTQSLRILLWGLPAICLVTGTLSLEAAHRIPNWPSLARLGDASYSIYLLHPMLIAALLHLAHLQLPLLIPASLLLAAAAGLLSFTLFERPIGKLLSA